MVGSAQKDAQVKDRLLHPILQILKGLKEVCNNLNWNNLHNIISRLFPFCQVKTKCGDNNKSIKIVSVGVRLSSLSQKYERYIFLKLVILLSRCEKVTFKTDSLPCLHHESDNIRLDPT